MKVQKRFCLPTSESAKRSRMTETNHNLSTIHYIVREVDELINCCLSSKIYFLIMSSIG